MTGHTGSNHLINWSYKIYGLVSRAMENRALVQCVVFSLFHDIMVVCYICYLGDTSRALIYRVAQI